jgi:hypothetical protein
MTPEQMGQVAAGVPILLLGAAVVVGIFAVLASWRLHDKSEEIIESQGYTEDSIEDAASHKATGTLLLVGGLVLMAALLQVGMQP